MAVGNISPETAIQIFNERLGMILHNTNEVIGMRRAAIAKMLDTSNRDVWKESGWPEDVTLEDYQRNYDREGIAYKCVVAWALLTWSDDPEIYEDESAEVITVFETAWKELEQAFGLYNRFEEVDKIAGVGNYAVLFCGFAGNSDLTQPVQPGSKLLFVHAYPQSQVRILEVETDPTNIRYNQPKKYAIDFPIVQEGTIVTQTKDVHYSRIVHVASDSVDVIGVPRQQRVWNRILDLQKILGGSAEGMWQTGTPNLSFEQFAELGDVQIDKQAMQEEFQEFFDRLSKVIAVQGGQIKNISSTPPSPEAHAALQLKLIAATIDIPWRQFIGSEQGQLASEQDAAATKDRTLRRRNKIAAPGIVRKFVDKMIELQVLPAPLKTDSTGRPLYFVEWQDSEEEKPIDHATWGKTVIEMMANYISSGVHVLLPEREFLTRIVGFTTEEADAILEEVGDLLDSLKELNDINNPPDPDPNDPNNDNSNTDPTDDTSAQ